MERQFMEIQFINSTVNMTFYCLLQVEWNGIDLTDAAKKLTKNGQKIFLFRTPYFKQVALQKVEENRFRFVAEPESFVISIANESEVFGLRSLDEKTEWETEWRV